MFLITKDYISGTYREVPTGSIIAIVAGILYFLSPIDLIPDIIPVVGYVDDVFVLSMVYDQVEADLKRYKEWRDDA